MPITYSIAIDRNSDGDFSDSGEDITADVIDLRWRLGMARPYESVADISSAQITVRNPSGSFSPELNSILPGTRVRIQSYDGPITRTHFTGIVDFVEPTTGEEQDNRAVIHLQDILPWLAQSRVQIPPQLNVTADTVIEQIIDEAIVRRAVIEGYCIIDVSGYNLIDSVSIFDDTNVARSLETGKTTFAYIGDWWGDDVLALQAIRELSESERGRFYADRAGQLIFRNRHYTLITKGISATFADDIQGVAYTYGDGRVNQLSVVIHPREIGAPNTLLWSLETPQRIPQQSSVNLNLRFVDENDKPLGLLALDDLNFAFYPSAEGTGNPITVGVDVVVVAQHFTSITVQVINRGTVDAYLTDLNVYGKPLMMGDPLEIFVADGEGMYRYGLSRATLNLPALSDIETAQAFATYELSRRKHPSGNIRTMTVNTRDHAPSALALTLFDRIRITESQTGHNAQDYFIIGEAHHVSKGGQRHEVTWTLEPADSTRFVIIDDSTIDDVEKVVAPY